MRQIDEIVKRLEEEKRFLGKTIDNRTMNGIPIAGMPEQYKECERLLEICTAEKEGRLMIFNNLTFTEVDSEEELTQKGDNK